MKESHMKRLLSMIFILASFIVFLSLGGALVIFKCAGLKFCTVEGESMMPTVRDGTRLLLNPGATVKRFDIVVFENDGRYLIKRVVGVPGDDVSVSDGKLSVNGTRYAEPYLDDFYLEGFQRESFEARVQKGTYFVLGDNRDDSLDSREIGAIDEDAIVGVPILKISEP